MLDHSTVSAVHPIETHNILFTPINEAKVTPWLTGVSSTVQLQFFTYNQKVLYGVYFGIMQMSRFCCQIIVSSSTRAVWFHWNEFLQESFNSIPELPIFIQGVGLQSTSKDDKQLHPQYFLCFSVLLPSQTFLGPFLDLTGHMTKTSGSSLHFKSWFTG